MLEFGGFWRWFAHLFETWPPGVPPDPKKCENVFIFDLKIDISHVKKASIPSCFLNMFGDKLAGTVPPHFRLKKASNYCCFVLFYFYCFYIFLVRKRGQKHIALPNA